MECLGVQSLQALSELLSTPQQEEEEEEEDDESKVRWCAVRGGLIPI